AEPPEEPQAVGGHDADDLGERQALRPALGGRELELAARVLLRERVDALAQRVDLAARALLELRVARGGGTPLGGVLTAVEPARAQVQARVLDARVQRAHAVVLERVLLRAPRAPLREALGERVEHRRGLAGDRLAVEEQRARLAVEAAPRET